MKTQRCSVWASGWTINAKADGDLTQERQARLAALPGWQWRAVARPCSFLRVATLTRCGAEVHLKQADNGLYYCKRHLKEVDGEAVRRARLPDDDLVLGTHPTKRKRFTSKQPPQVQTQFRPKGKWLVGCERVGRQRFGWGSGFARPTQL